MRSFNQPRTPAKVAGKILTAMMMTLTALTSANSFARYDDGARYAFSSSPEQQSIQVFDLHKQELVEQIKLEYAPGNLAASEQLKALVISHRDDKRLSLMDLSTDKLTQIDYPLEIHPDYISVSPIGETLIVYDPEAQVMEVHAFKRKARLIRVENVVTQNSFTYNLDGSRIYWTDTLSGELKTIDLWSKSQSLKLSRSGDSLSAMTRSTDGRLGFISDSSRNMVSVVDLQEMSILREISVGAGAGRPWGTSDGQIMMIPNSIDATLTAISTLTLDVLYTGISVKNPLSINSGWLDTVTAIVGQDGTILFTNTATGQLIESFELGAPTNEGVVTSDSKTLAISAAGAVSFFDMRRQVLANSLTNLPVDLGKTTVAVSNNLCH